MGWKKYVPFPVPSYSVVYASLWLRKGIQFHTLATPDTDAVAGGCESQRIQDETVLGVMKPES